jgi:hypothetical protein
MTQTAGVDEVFEPAAEESQLDDALAELGAALEAGAADQQAMADRISEVREQHQAGESLSDILEREPRPTLLQLLNRTTSRLVRAGNLVRRSLVASLRREGLTTDQIARLFGVTRQRISRLLRRD